MSIISQTLDSQVVIDANIALHTRLAGEYNNEPHFRPENVQKVEAQIARLVKQTQARRLLDLGCGTGFVINIAKHYVNEVHGVDVTQAMMDRVDCSGPARIVLHQHDTGIFQPPGAFDMVTAYSFLHHLYDIAPTLRTAYNALRPGGVFYADLEPNYYFWDGINQLDRAGNYDGIVRREIEMVTYKDEDIEKTFGVDKDIFNHAEYGKSIANGFREEQLKGLMNEIGFGQVEVFYHWFIGQGALINDAQYERSERFKHADVMSQMLQRMMPLSRGLFKYIGFVAKK